MSYQPTPNVPPTPYGNRPRSHRAAAHRRSSTKLPIILGGVGAVLLLCIGGTTIAAVAGDNADQSFAEGYAKGVAAQASTAPQTAAPTVADSTLTTAATTALTTAPAASDAPASAIPVVDVPEPSATSAGPAGTAEATTIKVPNGVGLDYQSAQDLWRSAGLIVAPATDATGAHRLPLIDSNWVVLAQDLKAGSDVPDGTVITATVKKYSDD